MLHVVNFSGGAASALALLRVVDRFGAADVRAVFADTGSEASDVYGFIRAVGAVAGVEVVWLGGGGSIFETFLAEGVITNRKTGACLASVRLKREALERWRLGLGEDHVVYVGFGADEDDRMGRLRLALPGVALDFPLCWRPMAGRCDVLEGLEARGLCVPEAYELGYLHANCGGACVRAGIGQWAGLLRDYPERFAAAEAFEREFNRRRAVRGKGEFTILRDRRGGRSRVYALAELRRDVEEGRRLPDDGWRVAACSCGVD